MFQVFFCCHSLSTGITFISSFKIGQWVMLCIEGSIRRVRGHCWVAHQIHQGAASPGGREWSPCRSTQGYPKAPGAGEQWAKNPSLGGKEAAGGKLPCELRLWAPRAPHCLIRLHLQSTHSKIKLLRLSRRWPQSSKRQAGYKVLWVWGPVRLCWLPAYEAGSNSHKKICRMFSQSVWFWVINPINKPTNWMS